MFFHGNRHLFWSAKHATNGARLQEVWTCPMWLQEQPNGYVTWSTNVSVYGDKDGVLQCCRTKWHKNVVLKEKTGKFYDECHRHRAIRARGAAKTAVSTVRSLARTIWQPSITKSRPHLRQMTKALCTRVVQETEGEQGIRSCLIVCSRTPRGAALGSCPVNTCVRSRIASVITQLGRVVAGRHREMAAIQMHEGNPHVRNSHIHPRRVICQRTGQTFSRVGDLALAPKRNRVQIWNPRGETYLAFEHSSRRPWSATAFY